MEEIKILISYLKKYFMTGEEFNKRIQEIIKKLGMNSTFDFLLYDKEQHMYHFGEMGQGDMENSKRIEVEDGYSFQIRTWGNNSSEWIEELIELFSLYINKDYCDTITGLPATDRRQLVQKCGDTLQTWLKNGKKVAVFMIDLDHFKDVNTKYNHDAGTAVLSEFSRLLFQVTNKKAILVHQNGDEFDVLYPYKYPYEVVAFAREMYKEVKGHTFKAAPEIDLTMAMGIRLIEEEDLEFQKAREAAENAYAPKQGNVEKHRNSVRMDKKINFENYGRNSLELGIIKICNSMIEQIFHNPYLEYIVKLAESSELNQLQNNINELLEWIKPEETNNMRCTAKENGWDVKAVFSNEEVGLAVLKGILKKPETFQKEINYLVDGKVEHSIIISVNNIQVFAYKATSDMQISWKYVNNRDNIKNNDLRKTILVYAGNENMYLSEDIFYKIIYVDTRPTRSGNLPDFWAATLSELISLMKKKPDLVNILIFGDMDNTQKVLYYLNSIDKWGESSGEFRYSYISRKTYQTTDDIIIFKDKFSGNIIKCMSEDELIANTYQVLSKTTKLTVADMEATPNERFLERKLSYDEIKLDIIDGCRTESIAVAFPTVLEIIRNAYREAPGRIMIDQNGQKLFELTNFKIVLKKPAYNKLPSYYYNDEKELENYYSKTLGTDGGLFRKPLVASNQINEMIDHITSVIESERQYATRRAVLVVPNVETTTKGYSPLGLVAVWLAPRFAGKEVVIDYSFTWRTVEAIVGLPYSMYASVRFSEEITEIIAKRVEEQSKSMKKLINLGSVSYIAHSLHMFLDEASMNIVRGIVDEVSI